MKSNEVTIKQALEAFVDAHGLKEKLWETELRQKWDTIAGATIARYTKRFYVKNKKMYLETTAPVIKQEINYSKTVLIDTINKEIGDGFIKDIILL